MNRFFEAIKREIVALVTEERADALTYTQLVNMGYQGLIFSAVGANLPYLMDEGDTFWAKAMANMVAGGMNNWRVDNHAWPPNCVTTCDATQANFGGTNKYLPFQPFDFACPGTVWQITITNAGGTTGFSVQVPCAHDVATMSDMAGETGTQEYFEFIQGQGFVAESSP